MRRYRRFQFQEVQLKVRAKRQRHCVEMLSIPRGAVKRFCISPMVFLFSFFQFQEVQLKALSSQSRGLVSILSIPRGAVKSCEFGRHNPSQSQLSIPRGAVKRSKPCEYARLYSFFQFQEVQLKVLFKSRLMTASDSFNSKRCS